MTLVPQSHVWLSVHLYYNEPWETFLKEAIQPYLKIAMGTGIVEKYYFERNWEKGPHIRLHILGDALLLNSILKDNLVEHFENYYESKPSKRVEPIYPKDFPVDKMWHPNHSIQFVAYRKSLNIFEPHKLRSLISDHYFASTKVCLDYIATNWTYDDIWKTAIKLHLAFAFALGMEFQVMEYFFSNLFKKNLVRSTKLQNPETISSPTQSTEALKNSFLITYQKQKDKLIPFVREMYHALKQENSVEKNLGNWIVRNQQIAGQITLAVTQREIRLNENKLPRNGIQKIIPKEKLKYWPIYEKMIASTNNRLGILNKDEAFLAYIMSKCILEVRKEFINS